MVNKGEFNNLSFEKQVSIFNESLTSGMSIRKICEEIGIAKTTVIDRFKKNGFTYSKDDNKFITLQISYDNKQDNKIPDVGTNLEDQIKIINSKLRSIVKNFIEVGLIINTIDIDKSYEKKGYTSIIAFTQVEFGLSKNQTYNLINVAKSFTQNGHVVEKYKDFSFSQLVEMVSLPDPVKDKIDSNMTVKKIREVKSELKNNKTKNNTAIHNDKFKVLTESDVNYLKLFLEIIDKGGIANLVDSCDSGKFAMFPFKTLIEKIIKNQ